MSGEIALLEIQYSEAGVHKIKFADEAKIWDLGPDVPNAQTERFYFDASKRWIGIHGSSDSDNRIKTLGIITVDPQCIQAIPSADVNEEAAMEMMNDSSGEGAPGGDND